MNSKTIQTPTIAILTYERVWQACSAKLAAIDRVHVVLLGNAGVLVQCKPASKERASRSANEALKIFVWEGSIERLRQRVKTAFSNIDN